MYLFRGLTRLSSPGLRIRFSCRFLLQVLAFQYTVLLAAVSPSSTAGGGGASISGSSIAIKRSAVLIVRCIHLLNLQLHVYRDALRLEEEACRVEPPSLTAYQKRQDRPVHNFFAALAQLRPANVYPKVDEALINRKERFPESRTVKV